MRQEQCLEIRLVVAQATRRFRPATRRTAGAAVRANGDRLFATLLAAVPVGGSPTGAGGSPAPPIFKTGSYASKPKFPGQRQRSLYRLLRPSRRTIHGHLRDSFPNCSVALSAGG